MCYFLKVLDFEKSFTLKCNCTDFFYFKEINILPIKSSISCFIYQHLKANILSYDTLFLVM